MNTGKAVGMKAMIRETLHASEELKKITGRLGSEPGGDR
jgi:hypothetical protein